MLFRSGRRSSPALAAEKLAFDMPKADPALWLTLRSEWESTDLSLSDVAARLDVSVPTVSLRAKRECWVKQDVVQLNRISYTPKQMVEAAIGALMRAVNQTHDHASAIKAAGMLLDRTMGRVASEQTTPLLAPEGMPDPRALPKHDRFDPNSRIDNQAEANGEHESN